MPSATAAYRQDLERTKRSAFGPHDDAWLVVASLLEAGVDARPVERKRLVTRAARLAETLPNEAEFRRAAKADYGVRRTRIDSLAVLAEHIQDRGASNLANAVAELTIAAAHPRPLQYGRLLSLRARIARTLGCSEAATAQSEIVDRIGREEALPELRMRALVGHATTAQNAGNYPRMLAFARQAVRFAGEVPLVTLRHRAHLCVVVAAAKRSLFDEALQHAWAIIEVTRGDPVHEATALQTMGQLLLEIGDVAGARAAFSAVLTRELPGHVILPALGGLATAAARDHDERLLDWAVGEVLSAKHPAAFRWALASTLIECAAALAAAGRRDQAGGLARRGLSIAEAHGFNELVFEAEAVERIEPEPRRSAARLTRGANEIVQAVREMEPGRLPRHVRMTAGVAQ